MFDNNIIIKITESMYSGERILIIGSEGDIGRINNLITRTKFRPSNVCYLIDAQRWKGKGVNTVHENCVVPILDVELLKKFPPFDKYFIIATNDAAMYVLLLVDDLGVSPKKVFVTKGVFSIPENRLYKKDNGALRIAKSIPPEMGGIDSLSTLDLLHHFYDCLKFIRDKNIKGDIVNLGVARGWSMKFLLCILDELGMSDRIVHGFDTFDGFAHQTEKDNYRTNAIDCYKGINIEDVKSGLSAHNNFRLIQGDIADTFKDYKFDNKIAFTFFDMDDYTPTQVALLKVFENTSSGGFLVHDHYTFDTVYDGLLCIGQRLAVDEVRDQCSLLNLSGTNVFVKI